MSHPTAGITRWLPIMPTVEDDVTGPSDRDTLVAEVLAQSSDLVVVADASLSVRFASRGVTEILGYDPEEVIGRNGLDFLHTDDAGLFAAVAAQSAVGYVPRGSVFYRLRHKDGSYVTVELSGGSVPDARGGPGFWLLGRRPVRSEIYADVLHRLLDEKPLTMALEGIREAMLPDVGTRFCISLWLPDELPATIGDRLPAQLSGRSTPAGSPWKVAIESGVAYTARSLSELDEITAEAARKEGLSSVSVIPVAGPDDLVVATLTLWTPPEVPHANGSAQVLDRIKDLVAAAIRLHQQIEGLKRSSKSDPLTGLANRRALNETFSAQATDVDSSVLCLDLDGFKEVNDTYGHATGDELLQIVARRIQSAVRGHDLAVRLGGDEFAVICRGCGSEEAIRLSERILDSLHDPIVVHGSRICVRASIGVASGRHMNEEILQRADNALYRAKREGRDTIRVA